MLTEVSFKAIKTTEKKIFLFPSSHYFIALNSWLL